MSFKNKVVIVTGGSSGIGAAIAIHFAREGADVAIVGRSESKLNDVAKQISEIGKQPLIIKADITKDEELNTIVEKTIDKYGKLDVLINNAGLARYAAVDDENLLKVYDIVVNTNLRPIFALTSRAAPYLIITKGNIVNISSIAGSATLQKFSPSGLAAYCSSKAGLDHFSRVAAMELAGKGVRVNVVSPGPVETPILENAGLENIDINHIKSITGMSQPEEIADLVLYLASDKAKSITGSNYVIDCGYLVNH